MRGGPSQHDAHALDEVDADGVLVDELARDLAVQQVHLRGRVRGGERGEERSGREAKARDIALLRRGGGVKRGEVRREAG